MNNIKIKTKKRDDHLTSTDISLAFSTARQLEEYYASGGTLNKAVWGICGQSIAKATKTRGGLYTSIVGHGNHFKSHPFSSLDGKLGTAYRLR